ncbi:hypothetical protein IX51_10995 [uncultured archaeon]|nr:hypothetical protein IX51_10995 [uncultured archaeon]
MQLPGKQGQMPGNACALFQNLKGDKKQCSLPDFPSETKSEIGVMLSTQWPLQGTELILQESLYERHLPTQ